ncbi:unnamed protein product [Parajaminaea phylloscopi]
MTRRGLRFGQAYLERAALHLHPVSRRGFSAIGPRRQRDSGVEQQFPQVESATVKRLQALLSHVKQRHPKIVGKLPQRFNNQTWADFLEQQRQASTASRSEGKDASADSIAAVEKRLSEMFSKPKRMHDSYVELQLPFTSNGELLEKYIATSGKLRLGMVFEDLDGLAGDIAYQHVLGGRPKPGPSETPVFVVTASVDRLDLVVDHLRSDRDYRLSGLPIFVGKSSMEVLVVVDELDPSGSGAVKTCLSGRFTMVAMNGLTKKSQQIPPLELCEDDERQLFEFGQTHKTRKRSQMATALDRVPPTQEEAKELHQMWLADQAPLEPKGAHGDSPRLVVPASETRLSSTQHIHPQSANIHKRLFGGFIMRQAYELAWMVGASFSNAPINFLALDALSFHSPVPIGAILSMTSQIEFTSRPKATATASAPALAASDEVAKQDVVVAAISVLVETVDVETGKRQKTNTFDFSFDLGHTKRRVSPATYQEAMQWIEGKRRVELGLEIRRLYDQMEA